jgi:GntR family transcriptional regulator
VGPEPESQPGSHGDRSLPTNGEHRADAADEGSRRRRGLRRLLRSLDRAGPPAYAQIEERMSEAISSGDFQPGDRLPPERQLAEELGVSRMTLRQALEALGRRGLVRRTVGRRGGTFVAEPKIERDLTALAGLTEQLRRQGHEAGARVLGTRQGPAGPRSSDALGVERGAPLFEVVRLRLSDAIPLALERSLFPVARFPGLLDHPLDGSIYELLDTRYQIPVRRAVERLEPVLAGRDEASLLEIKEGSPLLLVERTSFDAGGLAVEYARDLFRGDRTKVLVESSL